MNTLAKQAVGNNAEKYDRTMIMKKIHKKLGNNRGVTLVELVVAAVIMLIAVIAIVAVVRTSTDLQITDHHRRQARAHIVNVFEASFAYNMFHDEFYVINTPGGGIITVDVGDLPFETDEPIPVVIEVRDNGNDFMGNMNIRIDAEAAIPNASINVPAHRITIEVCWLELNTGDECITLVKRLVDLR
ncbi:MAG: prepilin-type N-terminal cleavage/methylation domain-containing protein [Chitinispirillales bacterium]|nr:prepilin-type N-terminal cleavage/methylation domain-containing protein [Chitinispirillales bacterium]